MLSNSPPALLYDGGTQQGTMVAGAVNKKMGADHQQAREAWNTRKEEPWDGRAEGDRKRQKVRANVKGSLDCIATGEENEKKNQE